MQVIYRWIRVGHIWLALLIDLFHVSYDHSVIYHVRHCHTINIYIYNLPCWCSGLTEKSKVYTHSLNPYKFKGLCVVKIEPGTFKFEWILIFVVFMLFYEH